MYIMPPLKFGTSLGVTHITADLMISYLVTFGNALSLFETANEHTQN